MRNMCGIINMWERRNISGGSNTREEEIYGVIENKAQLDKLLGLEAGLPDDSATLGGWPTW